MSVYCLILVLVSSHNPSLTRKLPPISGNHRIIVDRRWYTVLVIRPAEWKPECTSY